MHHHPNNDHEPEGARTYREELAAFEDASSAGVIELLVIWAELAGLTGEANISWTLEELVATQDDPLAEAKASVCAAARSLIVAKNAAETLAAILEDRRPGERTVNPTVAPIVEVLMSHQRLRDARSALAATEPDAARLLDGAVRILETLIDSILGSR